MATATDDLLNERYIAQVLENDLRLLESLKKAEELQLDHVVAVSAQSQGRIPKFSSSQVLRSKSTESDVDLAFETYVLDARVNNDAAYAQSVQNEIQAMITRDWQYAQRVAAAERLASNHLLCSIAAYRGCNPGKPAWMRNLHASYKPSMTKAKT